jgi:WD40 repeat protein
VAVSRDGQRVAYGSDDGVRIWEAANGQSVGQPIPGHGVLSVAFTPDGQRIASGNADGDRETV